MFVLLFKNEEMFWCWFDHAKCYINWSDASEKQSAPITNIYKVKRDLKVKYALVLIGVSEETFG